MEPERLGHGGRSSGRHEPLPQGPWAPSGFWSRSSSGPASRSGTSPACDGPRRSAAGVAQPAPSAVDSAHGPILTGCQIDDAFRRVRRLAGMRRLMLTEGPSLDEFVTAAIMPEAVVSAVLLS